MFQNKQEFLESFDLQNTDYYDPILLSDVKYGFSIKRKYGPNVPFKPTVDENGDPIQIAVLWVVLGEKITKKNDKLDVSVRVAFYNTKKMYDEDDIKLFDQKEKRNTPPKDIESDKEYYYYPKEEVFKNDANNVITGLYILDDMFQKHCDTIHRIKGIELLVKIFTKKIIDYIFITFIFILNFLIEKIFRQKIKKPYEMPLSLTLHEFSNLDSPEGEYLDFWGWKAHKATIILFSVLVCVLTILKYSYLIDLEYYKYISKDKLVLAAHVVFTLAVIEFFPSNVLFPILNKVIKLRARIYFIKLKPFSIQKKLIRIIAMIILIIINYLLWF